MKFLSIIIIIAISHKMITSALFAGYALGTGAIIYNTVRIKLQDDFENEVRKLREYDFSHEPINFEKDLPAKCIILAKYNPAANPSAIEREPKLKPASQLDINESGEMEAPLKLLFSQVVSYSNVLDKAMYIEH
jgi:hypothetical protein